MILELVCVYCIPFNYSLKIISLLNTDDTNDLQDKFFSKKHLKIKFTLVNQQLTFETPVYIKAVIDKKKMFLSLCRFVLESFFEYSFN